MLSAEFLHRSDDGVCAGLQYHWSTLLFGKTSCFLFVRAPGKQISAVNLPPELSRSWAGGKSNRALSFQGTPCPALKNWPNFRRARLRDPELANQAAPTTPMQPSFALRGDRG